MQTLRRLALAFFAAALVLSGPAAAQSLETSARQALLVDLSTDTELLSVNPDQRMYPASMTKLMTAYLVFERLQNGTLSLDDAFTVSEKAWRKGGSKMFVEVGDRVKVEDLLRGIIIQSGNDATIVVAEGISGSEEAFAREMTAKAREIGMENTQFRNASGWPDPQHYTTARDLAILAESLIERFPEYYHLYSQTEYTYHEITQQNRNPLLYRNVGADGLKTGYTEESGYGLVASAAREDRRLLMVVNGLDSARERAQEAERLIDWGFREFGAYDLFQAGEVVDEIPTWLGQRGVVPVIIDRDVSVTLRRNVRDDMTVTLITDRPLAAPIEAGQTVGEVRVEAPGLKPVSAPVKAAQSIEKLGTFGRVQAALEYLIFGESR
ncbi:MAG: D-alanyl-D-alanine carboxypeptidase family protein [Marivibrio sp.]|uniref:D-alanyl-D-alanine carboxypeptidase family protein n=1 Tax=Marivibrio sp. TaxID=2039719 RepID=UPI0032ECAF65